MEVPTSNPCLAWGFLIVPSLGPEVFRYRLLPYSCLFKSLHLHFAFDPLHYIIAHNPVFPGPLGSCGTTSGIPRENVEHKTSFIFWNTMKHSKYLRKTGRMFHPAVLTVVAIPRKCTVGHITLNPINFLLHVSAYQKGHQAVCYKSLTTQVHTQHAIYSLVRSH